MTKRSWRTGTPCGATIALQAFFPSRSPVIPAETAQACRWRHDHHLFMQTLLERLEGCRPTQRRPSAQTGPSLPDGPVRYKLFFKLWDRFPSQPQSYHERTPIAYKGYVPGRPADRRCQTDHPRLGGCGAASCEVNDAEGGGETDLGDFDLFQNRASAPVLQSPLPRFSELRAG